ncbi:glycosyltransferase [Sphaerisporangium sp. B11E5]|uniref:glycosyltransferase n=1 Tax=Sphaerisporangium sp. B11E5 TaxID=3153563 RepID=UPI00325F53F4
MSSTAPRCSVIVPTYNRARLLRLTLDSLVRQTLPPRSFEVLVVDDGSADDTAEVVREYAGRLDLRYFYQEDLGYRVAKARNAGIAAARAEVCVFVDSGVLLGSGALAAYLAEHESRAVPVAVVGYVYCFNEDNEDGALMERAIDVRDPDATIGELRSQGKWADIREEFYERYTDDIGELPAPWLIYWTCNVSAPTALLRRVGGFDEAFTSWGGEDVELGYRLFRGGARFVLGRDAVAIHHPHDKSYEDNVAGAAANYQYMAAKYDTPIMRLVTGNHFFAINDVIRQRGLPSCADYLAARAAAPAATAVEIMEAVEETTGLAVVEALEAVDADGPPAPVIAVIPASPPGAVDDDVDPVEAMAAVAGMEVVEALAGMRTGTRAMTAGRAAGHAG